MERIKLGWELHPRFLGRN